MKNFSRRDAIWLAGLTAAAVPLNRLMGRTIPMPSSDPPARASIGMASYTFRAFTLDQALAMTRRLGVRQLTLKDVHLPLTSSPDEISAAMEKLKSSGIELTGCGVIYMRSAEEVRQAFAYAKAAGSPMIIGVPDPGMMDLAEQKVKETGIRLAIHNHGPSDRVYPTPGSAYKAIQGRDARMGLCVDVGHTQRAGLDPSEEIERYADRVLDIHCKDVSSADERGTTVEIGRGVIDIPRLLRTLARVGYRGILHCEHEKDEKDPLPGIAESIGYLRGTLAVLA